MLVLAAAAACTSSSSGSKPAPTLSEVTALLARHGAAVLHRSSTEFLADVDTDSSAAPFHATQAAQIEALRAVPLRDWAYSVAEPATDAAAVAASTKRLGGPTLIVHLSVRYRLAVGDAGPSAHDLWWTFVRRHGRVVVAADNDLANAGGTSWQGPWDFGPLVVHRSASTLVLGHPDSAGQLPAILNAADAAVARVSSVVGTGWLRQVVVLVPSSQPELRALGANSAALIDASAITVFDPAPGSDGAPTGARIVLGPSVWPTLTPAGREITLRHEITHVATARDSTINSPRWLVEGLAEYVAYQGSAQSVRQIAGELRAQIASGTLPSALPTDAAFNAGGVASARMYQQAWLACRLIEQRAGRAGLLRLYRVVGGTAAPGDGPVATGVRTVLHESLAAFVADWRRYLRAELG